MPFTPHAPAEALPPPDPPLDAIAAALSSAHRDLAVVAGRASRYPATVAPFAAIKEPTLAAVGDLATLLTPGEQVYLLGERPPAHPQLRWDGIVPCLQMTFPRESLPEPSLAGLAIEPLTCTNSAEMLALINLAWPGFFQGNTCRMGRYFGIRDEAGQLIAMGGERLVLPPWIEISGLCCHPAHAGRSLGTAVLLHLLRLHHAEGSRSFLHVTAANRKAIALYLRLGFGILRAVDLHRIERLAG